jgi:hypothetical protein
MELREKHPIYNKPLILFFYEGPLLILKSLDLRNIWGWFSVPPDCLPNARCSYESMRGIMNHFEKETLDLFKAGRKSELSHL